MKENQKNIGRGGARDGAGRPAGSPNKRTLEIQEYLEGKSFNPFERAIAVYERAMEQDPPDLPTAGRMALGLCEYIASKRKAIEVSAAKSGEGDFTLTELLSTLRRGSNEGR